MGEQQQDAVKIATLEAESVKRIQAVQCELTESGLVIIGGDNGEGKSSFLDTIAWVLGGEKFRPSDPDNHQTGKKARGRITLNNGLVAQRKGKNGSLTVTDPDGKKGGQSILNEVIELLALDLPRFMNSSDKEKAKTLLGILGVENELAELEDKEKTLYNDRLAVGKEVKKAENYAEELPVYEDVPEEEYSAQELINQQQEVLSRNAENEKQRNQVPAIEEKISQAQTNQQAAQERIDEKQEAIRQLQEQIQELEQTKSKEAETEKQEKENLQTAKKTAEQLKDESTEELQEKINSIDQLNQKVRANKEKAQAKQKAKELQDEYANYTTQINNTRQQITDLLEGADLPLPELTVRDGELQYQGQAWDCMADSEKLKVATAIVRRLNPQCGFVLVDQLEAMDTETLRQFASWAQAENLQVIGTRVSTGDECSLIIEDGQLKKQEEEPEPDCSICPIPGKYEGKKWADIPEKARQYALDYPHEVGVTEGHIEEIKKTMQ